MFDCGRLLGTYSDLLDKLHGEDPIAWAQQYIKELNEKNKEDSQTVLVPYSTSKQIQKDKQRSVKGGFLFLAPIYYGLKLNKVCDSISKKYKSTFDLDTILSRLIYGRILFPASKLNTMEQSSLLIEKADFEIQHVYRALEMLSKETEFIQSELYHNSLALSKRNKGVLYYDCTNFFFEIEQEAGIKKYGCSKEHRPNPIVQMGLFMDGDGIPLAFHIDAGNTNEQVTLKPLEKQILKDFELSRFVVCTDAGLASNENRLFNDVSGRAFITTQSIKKLKAPLREWALSPLGWKLDGAEKQYDISQLEQTPETKKDYKDKTFYKECRMYDNGLEQRLIVTYSMRYRDYQRKIRDGQIDRAQKLINSNSGKISTSKQNDFKRFIAKTHVTKEGEVAKKELYSIDSGKIMAEAAFDGFYGICTNLSDAVHEVVKVNHRRWEIEECFRIMKTEFKARPVYLSRDDRIIAHFTTCFLALVVYRYLEKKLNYKYTTDEIITNLRSMDFYEIPGEGYVPTYTRTDFTDDLHAAFGFRTDTEIVSKRAMKNILKITKS